MTATVQAAPAASGQSAERVLRVLELIGAAPTGTTAREIADTLGLHLSTTYRLLKVLERQGFVWHRPDDHRFVLGRTVDRLGRSARHQLVATPGIREVLRSVHVAARAPVYLTVFRGDDIAVVHIADSPQAPRIRELHVGFAEVSHVTAFGKLMLATKDDADVEAFLDRHHPVAVTPRSITDATKLREQLDEIRAQQVAVEVEEYMAHLACIAAPVRTPAGKVVGAVSVSVQAQDFSRRAAQLERVVRRGAWQVTTQGD